MSPHNRMIVACFVACAATLTARAATAGDASPPATFAEPSVSPDHSEIAFLSGGDVWSVSSRGGVARLLADTGGTAERPLFSPDGTRIAYVSTKPGDAGIEVLDLAAGRLHRITYDERPPDLDAWSADGRYLYFSSSEMTIGYPAAIRRVPTAGGTPVDVRGEPYVNQMDGMPSPDGSQLAYVRNGFTQWWRRGHSHIDTSSITVERTATRTFESVTDGSSKDRWPMWSPDGSALYYVSDRSGTDELWVRRDRRARQATTLGPGRIVWPTIARDGKLIAFERGMALWTYDPQSGVAHALAIEPRGLSTSLETARQTLRASFGAFDLAPDGKKLAFIAGASVFAVDAAEGGDAQSIPMRQPAAADEPVWAHDSRRVAYVLDRGDEQAIATYAFPDGPEKTITPAGHHDDYPHWSPDGTKLEFVRDGRELHLIDVATQNDRVLARGTFDRRPFGEEDNVAFSPGGDWLAFVDNPPGGFANAYVIPVDGGTQRAITALPNTNTGPLAWAPDGSRLYVVTSQRTENGAVAQVDLVPRAPRFREDTFRSLFDESPPKTKQPAPASPEPSAAPAASATPARAKAKPRLRIDFAGIAQRVTLLPTGLDVARVSVTPDGKTLVLDANAAGQQNLYAFSVDETSSDDNVATQLTNTPGLKARTRIAPDGKSVVYEDDGKFARVALDGKGDAKPLAVSASFDVDFERDKRVVFAQVWSTLDRWYADPHFNGVDWSAERRLYEAHALAAHTRSEFERIVNLMIGELNSSHSGYRAAHAPGTPAFTLGRIGANFDPEAYARDGSLRFSDIVPLGPLALAGHVKIGDTLLAVDGVPVDPHVDVASLLANTTGKRTELRIAPGGNATLARIVVVLPTDSADDTVLRYRAWVAGRRGYVERISGGKLGYVHLRDMEPDALEKFYGDLDVANREKLGVVIDLRNNQGGFVDPYALDTLARREYLRFRSRFGNDAPARTALGQRALDRPTVLVVNEHTLSDGEDFTQGYRALHLGRIVGVPTAGWIIFTSETTLADGSQVRVPSTSVIADDGTNMEQHPRKVDIPVENSAAASERGDDPQLDAAVRELLKTAPRASRP
jgi:tricorn protease